MFQSIPNRLKFWKIVLIEHGRRLWNKLVAHVGSADVEALMLSTIGRDRWTTRILNHQKPPACDNKERDNYDRGQCSQQKARYNHKQKHQFYLQPSCEQFSQRTRRKLTKNPASVRRRRSESRRSMGRKKGEEEDKKRENAYRQAEEVGGA